MRAAWRDLAAHRPRPGVEAANGLLVLALTVLAVAILIDFSLAFDVAEARVTYPAALVDVFQLVTKAGQSGWLFALSILTILYALHRQVRATTAVLRARYGLLASQALYIFAVQAVSGILSQVVKHIVGRARPSLLDTLGPAHFDVFSLKAVLASFPSGHTTTAFAIAASLAFFLPRRLWPLLALFAGAVAASRLIVGAHYPSDVLAGAMLGLGSALLVARAFARRRIAFTLRPGVLLPAPRKAR